MNKAVKSNGSYCMALALRIVLVLQRPRVSAPGPMHSQSQWLSHDGVVCECYRFSIVTRTALPTVAEKVATFPAYLKVREPS